MGGGNRDDKRGHSIILNKLIDLFYASKNMRGFPDGDQEYPDLFF